MTNKKYLDLDSLKEYHLKLKPVIESKANSSDVYNKTDVYNKSEVDAALDSKSDVRHTHDQYVTEQNVYTKEQVDAALNLKANSSDVYTTSQVDSKLGEKANSSDVYTKTEVDNALNGKADVGHDHPDYVSNVAMAPSSSGSKWVSGIPGNFSTDFGDGPVYPVSGTTNIGVGLDEKNITFTPGEGAKRAIGSYDSSTGDYSWTLHGTAGNTKANGRIAWTSGDNQLKVTKDGTTRTIGYFNTINGESIVNKTESKNFDIYTKGQVDTALNAKANSSNVYNKSEVDTKLNNKANVSDVYTTSDIDTKINGINLKLNAKADSSNVYTRDQIDTALNTKANASDVYTTEQVDNKLNLKANVSDVYTATTIDAKLNLKADSSNVYTRDQMDTALNLKANASDVYNKEQVDNGLSYRLPIVGLASKGETKTYNRYAQKGYTGGSSTYWYYKIATLPAYNSSSNYASLIITGRIGGWEAANMSSINALVFNRGAEGIVAIDLAKTSSRAAYNLCDIVCYREEHGETSVYLKCAGYFTFDISIEAYQHDITLPTSISKLTSVTGTEQSKLSTTTSRLEVYNGNAYIGGTRLVKSNESLKNPNALTFGSQTYDGSAAKTITASDLNTYTKTEVDTSLNTKANASDVYSKSDVDTKLSEKANKATTLSGYGITNAYTKTETDNLINSKTKSVVFDTYDKFIEFLEDTSQATYDYFNVGDSIYIKEGGANYWISGKEDIVEGGYSYNRIISGRTGSDLLGTDNIHRKTVTVNIGTTYTSVEPYEVKPQSEAGYSNFSWNSSTGDVKITLESLRPNTEVTVTLKTYTPTSAGGEYGYYNISNIGPTNYLPLSGGTLTGNLTGKYITGTWLQTTAASDLGKAPPKYGVISEGGWLYTRTLEETKSDLGINSKSPVESVIDYGDTSNTIKIGYRGNGLTASQIAYIAGYSVDNPNNPNEHKIKDISKDVLKSWLGYSEVSTGVWSPGSTWTGTSGYVWIIFPYDVSANTFNFTYGSGDRTGYGFAILQGEGCIRYFQSTTQLTRYSTSRITFSTQMRYIKFKM